jgi:outer membrane protein TolC
MPQRSLLLTLLLTGCTCFDIDRSGYGKYPESQRMQWTPPDPCQYDTFENKPCDIVKLDGKVDLPYLLDYALCHNPLTENSWALAKGAYYAFEASKGALYPSLTGMISETFEVNTSSRSSPISTQSTSLTGSAGFFLNNSELNVLTENLSISWLLLDFGGRCATIEAAKFALMKSNWTHNQTVQTVMFTVISNYYQAVQAIETRKGYEYSLEDAKESLNAANLQFEAGLVTKLDVLQAKSNFAQAEYNLVNAIANEEIALANLSEAAGLPPEMCIDIDLVENINQKEISSCVDDFIKIAKGSRNDLAAYFASFKESMAQERIAFSNMLPQVYFTGDMNKTAFSSGYGTDTNVSGIVGVQWNFFNGYQNEYLYYQSRLNVKAAYASWKNQELQVALQVVTAYNQFEAANENIIFAEDFYKYSNEAFQAALIGYKAGLNTILDLLTNETNLANARTQLIQARANWMVALANISYTTGMLFEGGTHLCQK